MSRSSGISFDVEGTPLWWTCRSYEDWTGAAWKSIHSYEEWREYTIWFMRMLTLSRLPAPWWLIFIAEYNILLTEIRRISNITRCDELRNVSKATKRRIDEYVKKLQYICQDMFEVVRRPG